MQEVLRKKLKKFWEKSEKNTLAQCKAKIWQNTADIRKAVRAGHTRTARKKNRALRLCEVLGGLSPKCGATLTAKIASSYSPLFVFSS